jgi:2-oxoglutarate ferredoxin oxidoreductase subunit alpha
MAEQYQTPVVVLTDFFLNNRVENIPPPRASEAERADGNVYPEPDSKFQYRRYAITESGISPRAIPGMEGFVFSATGLEHVEKGTPDYSPENHTKMTEKRYRKVKTALNDLYPPLEYSSGGKLDLGIIGWGSTFGSVLEAVQKLQKRGLNVGGLKITSIYPFHGQVIREFMGRCDDILIPELNHEGQLANLIDYLYEKDVVRLNQTTGLPFPVSLILEKSEEILGDKD